MINVALRRLAADVDKNNIEYAVTGAVALSQHGYHRFTEDIDLLMTKAGLEKFQRELVGSGYRPVFEGARKKICTTTENIPLNIITAGEYPGDGQPKPIVFPEPKECVVEIENIKTLKLEKLIELKPASGLSAPDRLKDLADVQELIKLYGLDAEYALKLDASVRAKYVELQSAVETAQEARPE